jgi:Uma2 family endonuclease
MSAVLKKRYTLDEYLEIDANSEERFEYFNGEIFTLSGVSDAHDRIESNFHVSLTLALRGKPRRVFLANMRLKVPVVIPYKYADSSALCGTPKFEKIGGVDVLTNPQLIVEILSPSTENYDSVEKLTQYKSIKSFTEYILIAQDRPVKRKYFSCIIHRERNKNPNYQLS